MVALVLYAITFSVTILETRAFKVTRRVQTITVSCRNDQQTYACVDVWPYDGCISVVLHVYDVYYSVTSRGCTYSCESGGKCDSKCVLLPMHHVFFVLHVDY